MKLSGIRRLTKEMLRGVEIPPWIDELFGALNPFIDQVTTAFSNNLTMAENMAGVQIAAELTHNEESEVNPKNKGKVIGVLLLSSSGQLVSAFAWRQMSNGKLGVTVKFDAGSGSYDCVLQTLEAR